MNIYVVMKRTFDTEEKVEIKDGRVDEEGAEFVINLYDEYAIEEAIVLKEAHDGEVTVVTVGDEEAEKELRTALAMGADKAVLLDTEDLEDEVDHYTISEMLNAFFKDKEYDIILGGNVAVDDGAGQVAPRLAELLDINQVTTITKLDIEGTKATIERDVEGTKSLRLNCLCLLRVNKGNEPRYPSLPGIMKAKKKPLETLDLDDLGLDEDELEAKTKTVDRFLPPEKQAGKKLEGEPAEQVEELIKLLKTEAKVI
ncbi:LOW QUALITY PROTEIN: electron transfer flavoprotein, beta subunit [Geomicrobium sp. JCM 19037]|nr:LOW QUALITY PROTEIN: electron transfer flavoprotein, beta subunit [Geomicrobium sp. JCM 19037]